MAFINRKELRAAMKPGLIGRAADRVIREVFPRRAVRRMNARAMLALGDGYEIAKGGRRLRSRSVTGGTADKHLDPTSLHTVREICRDCDRNSPLMAGILDRWADNVVGPSFNFEPKTKDGGWNKAAKEMVDGMMGKECHLRRKLTFRRLVRLWTRSVATDGDILPVFTKLGIGTYEADQLATPIDRKSDSEGTSIINGVKVHRKTGRDLGYYVAERTYSGWLAPNEFKDKATFIPARDAILPANYIRTSQTRGVPVLASSMKLFEHFDSYLEAEQIAAEMGAMFTWFIRRDNEAFFATAADMPPGVEKETASDGTEMQLQKMEPGSIITGDLGDQLELVNPERPAGTFQTYVLTALRMFGAGLGMPLELVLLDFSKTSYSSARASLLQAYRTFMQWQEWVKEEILGPIYRRWIGQLIASRELSVRRDAMRVQWFMPRWAWVDPMKEVQAAEKAVAMGIDTLTDYIEREHQTVEEYVIRRAQELKAFREAKIPTTTAKENLTGETKNAAAEAA